MTLYQHFCQSVLWWINYFYWWKRNSATKYVIDCLGSKEEFSLLSTIGKSEDFGISIDIVTIFFWIDSLLANRRNTLPFVCCGFWDTLKLLIPFSWKLVGQMLARNTLVSLCNIDSVHKILYIDNDFEKLVCASKHISDQIAQSFGFTRFITWLKMSFEMLFPGILIEGYQIYDRS